VQWHPWLGYSPSYTTGSVPTWHGFITAATGGNASAPTLAAAPAQPATTTPAGLPADFADWLRACHAETSGSAREAYARVAERLSIRL
jgi:hypothetical protein